MKKNQPLCQVLVVEPDKLLASTYRRAMEDSGITSEWQSSAQDAIDSIDKSKPKLIILELQLHVHNGIEFLHELRSYPDWQMIPIILLTLVPEHELGLSEDSKKQLNIVGYHYKPHTSLEQLVEFVNEELKRSA